MSFILILWKKGGGKFLMHMNQKNPSNEKASV